MSDLIAGTTQAATAAQWQERYAGALMNTFGAPQRVLVRGEGAYVWDADGRRYLDLLAGIAVNCLGHTHPTLTGAIAAQFNTLGHVSNFFATPTQIALAERLLALAEPGGAPAGSKVFFTNSGTEAIEAAFKLARKHGGQRRPRVLAAEGAFHGRSMGALALTYKSAYKDPFGSLPGGVTHVPFGDAEAIGRELAAGDVAAVVLEPIQGEAGVRLPPPGYLAQVRELTRAAGALLILDEVQTGMGRCGAWMAHHLPEIGGGIVPDAIALAKGLGGGFPVGALVTLGADVSGVFTPGNHGTTFGGNPMAAAAGLATIHVIERDDLLAAVRERGEQLRAGITALPQASGEHALIRGVRGEGLLLGVELTAPIGPAVVTAALEAGFIVNAAAPTVVRLAPPFILSAAQAQDFIDALPAILAAAERATGDAQSNGGAA
ncbi:MULTISPECIES: acetylornithine transaminase [unclassified Pseudactinotalea]|uniref:acetylornithine transaminase n=1 Tax=unclassified Pseudactinotalea TaxID=2649176 RepID=UPI00128CFDC8|nr:MULTISPECIES: acetylornithine transaminase [unclassified Pseudactinotalea]MPV51171.1 acetylornithine transaminase [Pseudactinotalea sp. HY160]QGH69071.1 acetylornithine transaminase [Pseudactinotalea sp. HY158]